MTPILTSTQTSYKDINVKSASTYYYAVTAVDISGNEDKNVASTSGVVDDLTKPVVAVVDIGSFVSGTVTLQAVVSDIGVGLKQRCEVCLTNDAVCDTEWQNAAVSFIEGAMNGTCSFSWDTSGYSGRYYYNFRVNDLKNQQGEGSVKETEIANITTEQMASISLLQGWNLFSITLVPSDASTERVLSTISGSYSKIYHYDPASDTWLVYNPKREIFDQPNTLLQLSVGKSYWIEMLSTATLEVTGLQINDYSASLAPGWNYIGYPYMKSHSIATALSTIGQDNYYKIYSYNASYSK